MSLKLSPLNPNQSVHKAIFLQSPVRKLFLRNSGSRGLLAVCTVAKSPQHWPWGPLSFVKVKSPGKINIPQDSNASQIFNELCKNKKIKKHFFFFW